MQLPTTTEISSLGTILGVWAHPDDEAYLSAGVMAMARQNGQRVVVVTATAGEQGTDDPDVRGTPEFASHRRGELKEALGRLGVTEHVVLGLPDGGCDAIAVATGARLVGHWLAAVRPDTILTFGPEGMTGHPDHQAVSAWTRGAWARTGRSARLLQATLTPDFHAEWGELNDRVGLWMGDAPCTDPRDVAIALDCRPVLDRKIAALEAHESQTAPLRALVGESTYATWWASEWFVDAAPRRTS